jgi:hypothetical protein
MATSTVIVFEEYPDDEFRLRLAPVPIGEYLDFRAAWASDGTIDEFRAQLDWFARLAQPEWTHNHPDLPAGASLPQLDVAMVKALVAEWLERVPSVPRPLPLTSSGGDRSAPGASTRGPADPSGSRPRSSGRRSSRGS